MIDEIAREVVGVSAAGSVPEIASVTVTTTATIAAADDEADARLVPAAVVAEVAEDVIKLSHYALPNSSMRLRGHSACKDR